MTYDQFYDLHLTQICSILNAYDRYLLGGEESRAGNGNGLDRWGRGWLYVRGISTSSAFEYWLGDQDVANFPMY
jgi:hypothetical protein